MTPHRAEKKTTAPQLSRDWSYLDTASDTGVMNLHEKIITLNPNCSYIFRRILDKVSLNHKFIGTDALDLMKFICKEFWEEIFKKKV